MQQEQHSIRKSNKLYETVTKRYKILEKDGEFYIVDFSRGFFDLVLGLDVFLSKKAYPIDISNLPIRFKTKEYSGSTNYGNRFKPRFYLWLFFMLYWQTDFLNGYCNLKTAIWISIFIIVLTSLRFLMHFLDMRQDKDIVSEAKYVDFDHYIYVTAILGRSSVTANIREAGNYIFLVFSLVVFFINLTGFYIDSELSVFFSCLFHYAWLTYATRINALGGHHGYRLGLREIDEDPCEYYEQ